MFEKYVLDINLFIYFADPIMSKRRTRSSTVRDEILDDESQMDPDYTPESGSGLSQSSGTTEEDVIEIGSDENSDRRAIADSEVDVDEFIRGAKEQEQEHPRL